MASAAFLIVAVSAFFAWRRPMRASAASICWAGKLRAIYEDLNSRDWSARIARRQGRNTRRLHGPGNAPQGL
jgi:hypothetical protein